MVYMIGLFIGSYVIGFASDKFGRKITMMTSLLFLILGGSLAGMMPTYPLYVCCYVVASIAGYGMFVCPFLLTVELLPAEKKTFISMMTNFPFVIGMSLMCLIAWVSKDYQLMHLLGYLPLIVFFPLWFILPESPRWLLAKGRVEQFRKEIKFGARLTGVKLEGSLLTAGLEMEEVEEVKTAKLLPEKELKEEPREVTEVGFVDILKSRTLLPILLVRKSPSKIRTFITHFGHLVVGQLRQLGRDQPLLLRPHNEQCQPQWKHFHQLPARSSHRGTRYKQSFNGTN